MSAFPTHAMRVWLGALMPGLLAAVAGWAVAEQAGHSFHWDGRVSGRKGRSARSARELTRGVAARSATFRGDEELRRLAMGIFGAAFGLSLGAGGGLSRRSPRAAAAGGLMGFLLGAAVGTAVPLLLLPVVYRSPFRPPNPAFPSLVHSAMYASIGGVGGIAFGGVLGGPGGAARAFVAGALGEVFGAITYNVVHTIAFPMEWDLSPMPGKGFSRLLAHVWVAFSSILCVVLATEMSLQAHRREKAPPER